MSANQHTPEGAVGASAQAAGVPVCTPTPEELLPMLAAWMAESGVAADHPWRVAIDRTMKDWKGAEERKTDLLEVVFCGISGQAQALMRLVNDLDADQSFSHAGVFLPCLGRIGWFADLGLARSCSWEPKGTDGGEWLLTAYQAKLLKLSQAEE